MVWGDYYCMGTAHYGIGMYDNVMKLGYYGIGQGIYCECWIILGLGWFYGKGWDIMQCFVNYGMSLTIMGCLDIL